MCGRYTLGEDDIEEEELEEIIAAVNRRLAPELKTQGEIFPTDVVPVLAADGPLAMQWGFARPDAKGRVINARAETLLDRPMFRDAALQTRCLVPAVSYYEWETCGRDKLKQRLRTPDARVMYMAALYRREWGATLPTFTIVTREAAPAIAHIHDRMPVILAGVARRAWLEPGKDISAILKAAELGVEAQPEAGAQQQLSFWG